MACVPDVCMYLVGTCRPILSSFVFTPFTFSCLEVHENNLRVKHSPNDGTYLTIHMLDELEACVAVGDA